MITLGIMLKIKMLIELFNLDQDLEPASADVHWRVQLRPEAPPAHRPLQLRARTKDSHLHCKATRKTSKQDSFIRGI